MNPVKEALPFIKMNLGTYGIEWINTDRASTNFKFLIFGRPNFGKQFGIYQRETTVIRLEKYDQIIEGITIQHKCAKSHAAESEYSNFKNERGDCVSVENTLSLKKL